MDRSLSARRRAGAEALAAFALVFAGCGAIIANKHYHGALGSVGISLVFGLIIMVMIYATGHLSGAHINPAVTIAFTLTRQFSPATRSRTSPRNSPAPRSPRWCCSACGQTSPRISARPCRRLRLAARFV